jgi:hypothetical protein
MKHALRGGGIIRSTVLGGATKYQSVPVLPHLHSR